MERPANCNDVMAWDAYYRTRIPNLAKVEKYNLEQDLRFLHRIRETPARRIWFAGCGLDLSPWLYANLGCDVVATDISPFAVEVQNELLFEDPFQVLEKLPNILKEMQLPTAAEFRHPAIFVHDMCRAFPFSQVNMLVNNTLCEGLSEDHLRLSAKIFSEALLPDGILVCATEGLEGAKRTIFVHALQEYGFFLPGIEAEQWYRSQLETTNIRFAMKFGHPMILSGGQYQGANGKDQQESDRAILRSLRSNYELRRKENAIRDKIRSKDGEERIAYLVD